MNKAFTLAEVLLTLAIIGVVAALTVPGIVTKVQQDQYVVGLKKAFNTLKTFERKATADFGPIHTWDLKVGTAGIAANFDKYFAPYIDTIAVCQPQYSSGSDDCFMHNDNYKRLDGKAIDAASSSNIRDFNNGYNSYQFITPDGIYFTVYIDDWTIGTSQGNVRYRAPSFYVDVNGKKGPNRMGRDLFVFRTHILLGGRTCPQEIYPVGKYAPESLIDCDPVQNIVVNRRCSEDGSGALCAVKVLAEGTMNY